jgi:hypothetical protein
VRQTQPTSSTANSTLLPYHPRVAPVPSPVLRGFALWATHLRMRLERGRAIRLGRGCAVPAPSAPAPGGGHGTPQRGRQVPRTTISPHPEVPRRGLEGRGRVVPVASPVLRGFALRATHLRMRLERGRAGPRAPYPPAGWRHCLHTKTGLPYSTFRRMSCPSRKATASLDPLSGGVNRWTNGRPGGRVHASHAHQPWFGQHPLETNRLTEIRPYREPSASRCNSVICRNQGGADGPAGLRRPGTHP